MTTEAGRNHVKARLARCETLDQLRQVWERLGVEYQRCPEVMAFKDKRKSAMQAPDGRAA